MTQENQNQPREFDAVLGGQTPLPINGVVLGGIEGVKHRLNNPNHQVQSVALYEAVNYGDVGLEIIVQTLKHQQIYLRLAAYSILKSHSEAWIKEALEDFNKYELLHCDRTFTTGFKQVNSLAISLDNQIVVCGGGNNSYNTMIIPRVWNLDTGESFVSLQSHHLSDITSVAISPDRQQIISAATDRNSNTIVWDVNTGRQIYNLQGHSGAVHAIAIHPDGQTFFSAGQDGAIRIRTLQSWREIGTLEGHSRNIYALCVTSDGNLLVSGGDDRTIRVWDISTKQQIYSFGGHTHLIRSLAISPDGRMLVSGSDQRIKVWDLEKKQEKFSFYGHADWVRSIVFTPDNRTFLSAGDANIKVWDTSTGKKIYSFKAHSQPIRSLALSSDGQILVSGSSDGTVKVWRFQ